LSRGGGVGGGGRSSPICRPCIQPEKKIKRRERNHWRFDVVGKGLYLSSRNVDPSTKLIDSSGGSLCARWKQRR